MLLASRAARSARAWKMWRCQRISSSSIRARTRDAAAWARTSFGLLATASRSAFHLSGMPSSGLFARAGSRRRGHRILPYPCPSLYGFRTKVTRDTVSTGPSLLVAVGHTGRVQLTAHQESPSASSPPRPVGCLGLRGERGGRGLDPAGQGGQLGAQLAQRGTGTRHRRLPGRPVCRDGQDGLTVAFGQPGVVRSVPRHPEPFGDPGHAQVLDHDPFQRPPPAPAGQLGARFAGSAGVLAPHVRSRRSSSGGP